jgi:hypothetical protein
LLIEKIILFDRIKITIESALDDLMFSADLGQETLAGQTQPEQQLAADGGL